MKLSVIIPIYNAEPFLHRCLDSVLGQSFSDFEVLLINDGSTDQSAEICGDYAMRDSRIRLFNFPNSGVSFARQIGIDNAVGEYSIHVDPDDYVDRNMLEDLLKEIGCYDILITDYYRVQNNKVAYQSQFMEFDSKEMLLRNVVERRLHGSLCNKLIRHSIYRDKKISFPKDINYCEDQIVFLKMILADVRIKFFPKSYYYYVYSSSSLTGDLSLNRFKERIRYINYIDECLSLPQRVSEVNKLLMKVDMMYSKNFDGQFLSSWNSACNKYVWSANLTIATRIRLFLTFIGLYTFVKNTF